ncbi:MAG: imidazole glycerol phosphate synthase cyclase subunit [bacterium]|nr:imidazole glycerol phosphate synthase cyclase subunit [bacterium]
MQENHIKPRLIARLDIKGTNVVKGIHFEGLRIMGDPDEMATAYYEQGADELLYIDTVASLYGRNNLLEVVRGAAKHLFIPMTVGGGVRSPEDVKLLLRNGADKVAINTAAVANPHLISEIAEIYGSQVIVVSLQTKLLEDGRRVIFTENGREASDIDALDWAKRAEELGAGELLLTSIDQDGTGRGFDVEFAAQVTEAVSLPVIVSGGGNKPEDVSDVIHRGGVDAVAVASMLHYKRATIGSIKEHLEETKIPTARH